MRALYNCIWFLLLMVITGFSAQVPAPREYRIKAAFLYNFTQFVEWSKDAFDDKSAPLVIGILGEDPFDGFLDETIENEKVNGHPLTVERYEKAEDVKGCHLLFISSKGESALLFQNLNLQNVLTVGDSDDFIQQGGVIRLFIEKGKIRMQVNVTAANTQNLKISSKLLRVAEIVSN